MTFFFLFSKWNIGTSTVSGQRKSLVLNKDMSLPGDTFSVSRRKQARGLIGEATALKLFSIQKKACMGAAAVGRGEENQGLFPSESNPGSFQWQKIPIYFKQSMVSELLSGHPRIQEFCIFFLNSDLILNTVITKHKWMCQTLIHWRSLNQPEGQGNQFC